MKFCQRKVCCKALFFFCFICAAETNLFALDREAFSFRNYDLDLQVEPEQHRLGVRGKITLRNDSTSPQKVVVLQISSSLDWRSIRAADRPLQFITQPYTSDIDHTGALSEAIVTMPQPVAPHASVELEIAYEGLITLDATRLTRIGAPDQAAHNSDWDQIGETFTAVRGAGYVAWYPVATTAANLSEGNSLFEALVRWKTREAGAQMKVGIRYPSLSSDAVQRLTVCGAKGVQVAPPEDASKAPFAQCSYDDLTTSVPSFAFGNYGMVARSSNTVYSLPTHAAAAEVYADASEKAAPLIKEWFGTPREKAQTADLPEPGATPFESGALLLTPLVDSDPTQAGLAAAHQLTHGSFVSSRPWIEEGLAHFAQALYLEQQKGRQAALDYMGLHRAAFGDGQISTTAPNSEDESSRSLVNTINEELYRSKAMCVWWMLRDMVGDAALKKALAAYRPEQDREPSYMARLISAQTQRDLEWFFDDWVYRDRGLPDFKVEFAFPRKTLTSSYMLTITLDNLGSAGAEVPVRVKFGTGEITKRLEVRAKDKATIRIETPAAPQEIVVNDGSVPESDRTNNTFKIEVPQK